MTKRSTLTTLTLLAATVLAATPALAQADTGNANMSKIVALGDSLVAGESNSSLNELFQDSAFPLLVHRQVHGTTSGFEQPWIADLGNHPRLILDPVTLAPTPAPGPPGVELNRSLGRAFDNLGMVGGARVADLTQITSAVACGNDPYTLAGLKDCSRFDLTLRFPGTGGLAAVSQALSLDPTFVLIWVGGNDALQAAALGFLQVDLGGGLILPLLTPASGFETAYRGMISAMLALRPDLQFALATVPDVSSIPLLNTLPWFLTNQQTRQPVFDSNGDLVPLLGLDAAMTGVELLAPGDRVSLPAASEIAKGCGVNPLFDAEAGITRNVTDCPPGTPLTRYVLRAADATTVSQTIDQYNDVIRTVAQETGAALFDAKALLDQIAGEGYVIGGIDYTAEFITGGIFSYDGFHPAPTAQAIIANGFIEAINRAYGARIPLVDLQPWVLGSEGNLIPPLPSLPPLTAEWIDSIRASVTLPTNEQLKGLQPVPVVPESPRAPRPRRHSVVAPDDPAGETERPRRTGRRGRR